MKTRFSRRNFLKSSTITGLMAAFAGLPTWMPRFAFAQPYDVPEGDVLVVVFLRGGADTLNMVIPYAEDAYYTARPQLAIPRPDASDDLKALDLDGFFGLHPALGALRPVFQGGQMTAVHAAGLPYHTRSHFQAMDFMERGTPGSYNLTTGWIGRHLASLNPQNPSPMRGIGWGASIQPSLSGTPSTIAMQPTTDYTNYQPQHSAHYPATDFARALRQTAALIRADIGLEAACIDLGGWDTHVNQGGTRGLQATLMTRLAEGLAAFHQDMGADMSKVSVVAMSEFGRSVEENAYQGTDHGHGAALLVMSGNLNAGPVFADWPGLAPDALDQGGLAITTDYRDILAELLSLRLKNTDTTRIFPNYTANPLNLFRA